MLKNISRNGIEIGVIGRIKYRGRPLVLGVAQLLKHGVRGFATPKDRDQMICISTHLPINGPTCQEAIIHETLHIAFPKATERQVERVANLVARVLRKYEAAKREAA